MKVVLFNAASGFGNRILPLVSIYTWCKQNDVPMGVIWNTGTHRSGMPQTTSDGGLSLKQYFSSTPDLINVFSTFDQAKHHYQLEDQDVSEYDMQWQPKFDFRKLQCKSLLIKNCCFLISLLEGNDSVVGQRADLSPETQRKYLDHPHIRNFRAALNEFKFDDQTISKALALVCPETVAYFCNREHRFLRSVNTCTTPSFG